MLRLQMENRSEPVSILLVASSTSQHRTVKRSMFGIFIMSP